MGRKYAIAFKEGYILFPERHILVKTDGVNLKFDDENTNEIRNEI